MDHQNPFKWRHNPRIAQRDDSKEAGKGESSQRGKNVPPYLKERKTKEFL
jgi:hypothetical protein